MSNSIEAHASDTPHSKCNTKPSKPKARKPKHAPAPEQPTAVALPETPEPEVAERQPQQLAGMNVPRKFEVWRNGVFGAAARRPDEEPTPDVSLRADQFAGRRKLTRPIFVRAAATAIDDPSLRTAEVSFLDDHYHERNIWLPRAALASRDLVPLLSSNGYPVTSESYKRLSAWLSSWLDLNGPHLPRKLLATRIGLAKVNGQPIFVLPDEIIGTNDDVAQDDRNPLARGFAVAGDPEDWIAQANHLAAEYGPVAIAIATCCAAPLLTSLGQRSFSVLYWGESNLGKSAAYAFALSMYGPSVGGGGLYQTLGRSQISTQAVLRHVNGLPIALDELELAREKIDPIGLTYEIASEELRRRAERDGSLQNINTRFSTIAFLSGEASLSDYVSQRQKRKSRGGSENRYLNVHVSRPLPAQEIYSFIANNHGHVGRRYLRAIQPLLAAPEMRSQFNQLQASVVDATGGPRNPRHTMAAILGVGAHYAQAILGIDMPDALTFATNLYNTLDGQQEADAYESLHERALNCLRDYILMNPSHVFGTAKESTKVVAYVSNGEMLWVAEAADEILNRADLAPGRVWKDLAAAGILKSHAKNLKLQRTIGGLRRGFRVFDLATFMGESPDTSEGALPFVMPANDSEVA